MIQVIQYIIKFLYQINKYSKMVSEMWYNYYTSEKDFITNPKRAQDSK